MVSAARGNTIRVRGVAVSRLLCMQKAPGSSPGESIFFFALPKFASKNRVAFTARYPVFFEARGQFARAVKGVDLRSTGRRPRGFEPHSLHYNLLLAQALQDHDETSYQEVQSSYSLVVKALVL